MAASRAKGFFSQEEQARIVAAVQAAEKRTSGEIVPMVVDHSYDYPRAEVVGAGFFALATGAFLAWALGKESLWLFLGLFALFYVLFHLLIHHLPPLKRLLIHRAEMAAEVEEKALVAFVDHGLHRTRDGTGILILISLLESGSTSSPTAASTRWCRRGPGTASSPPSPRGCAAAGPATPSVRPSAAAPICSRPISRFEPTTRTSCPTSSSNRSPGEGP